MVSWLVEHPDIKVPESSESDSEGSYEEFSESEIDVEDDFEDLEGELEQVGVCPGIQNFQVY